MSKKLKLLPHPRSVRLRHGSFNLPVRVALQLPPTLPSAIRLAVTERLRSATKPPGVELHLTSPLRQAAQPGIRALQNGRAPAGHAGYLLEINARGVGISYRAPEGLRAAVATLRQLLREYGRVLPRLVIRDHADFAKRGVMLDISRGRVPRLETLLGLVEHLADFKLNEFQLYTEHTFAYRRYRPVWRGWGALTGAEIRKLDARCRELGIELVPNQNSFGHLRQWLAHPPLRKLAETGEPWPDQGGAFLRYPSTLAPVNPGTLPFLRGLYDELLPNFTSPHFNVGCDETWDLGRGQSKALCEQRGKGRVYLDFLRQIHRETKRRKKQMMFWGDIILHHPELIRELPKDVIALNWGYEAGHPFGREAAKFRRSKIPFYVCPGTSTWMSLIGRHDNAFLNLRRAAKAGLKHGARGLLITDWGDGGHPQPLAVSCLPYLLGAAVSWCGRTADESLLVPVANRDIFHDPTEHMGEAALGLGLAHRQFKHPVANATPFGAVIAAPPPKLRELFCLGGLKYHARISPMNVKAALSEVEAQRSKLRRSPALPGQAEVLKTELDLAARMAAQSCRYMLWQQSLAVGRKVQAAKMARRALADLRKLEQDFNAYWPIRNKATPKHCSAFLRWRRDDYRRGHPPLVPQPNSNLC
jgi:hexosaminidase